MYITGLEASGLKGLSFAHQLERCVLFTGPNFIGKSARLQAIRFGVRGSVPELGKTNQSVFELSGGGAVRVGLRFDNKAFINRALVLDKGSVTAPMDATMPTGFFDAPMPMPMLDPEEYFNLTDSERIQYVFGMMKMPETFTRDGIFSDLRNLSLDENTEQTERARGEIIDLVNRSFSPGCAIPAAMLSAIGDLKTEFTLANRRAKDTVGTLRVLSELKTREGECSADTIQGIAGDMKRVAAELATANQVAGSLSQRQMEANRVALRRRQIEQELSTETIEESPRPHEAKIAELDAKLKKATAVDQKALLALAKANDDAESAVARAGETRLTLNQDLDAVLESIVGTEALTACPHCGSKGKDWKKNLLAQYDTKRDELASKIAVLDTQLKSLNAKWKKARLTYTKAKTAYDARQQLLEQRQQAQREVDAIKARQAGAQARRRALQQEVESLADVKPPSDAELTEAAEKVSGLNQERARLSERHTALTRLQQDLIRAGEAAEEHQLAAAKVAVIKAVGAKLKEKQAEMITVVFRDLMKVANYFTSGIMEHELVFSDGRIGYVKHGRFVSHKTFSGTEKALTYIAITAALMKDAPLRLVLLDEFDIDADVFPKVLNRLASATREGVIDQVIVAHTDIPRDKLLAGDWQHIPLRKAV